MSRIVPTDFSRLFAPRSVAVIGASADPGSISGEPVKHLQTKGFAGAIYPINPRRAEIAGLRCYPDLDSVPAIPDLVVVAIAACGVPEAMRAIGSKGCPFAIVLSSGFAESGEAGARMQEEIAGAARAAGVCLIGPNCQGLMNVSDDVHIGFGAPYALRYRKGSLSMTSQSGAFGNSLLMQAEAQGIGFRHYISTGNEAATTTLDLLEFFLDDPGTSAVAGYIEGLADARRLLDVGHRALERGKPLMLWKAGNSAAGARAAATHTANLSGTPALYRAAFRQAGILEIGDAADLVDYTKAFRAGRLPAGNRVAVLTISGGAGIVMADECARIGLELPEFAPATAAELRRLLPPFASVGNPADVTAAVLGDPQMFHGVLRAAAADPNVDLIALPLAAVTGRFAASLAREIAALATQTGIPTLVAWNGPPDTTAEGYRVLDEAGVPRYESPVRCARGCGALWQHAQARRRLRTGSAAGEATAPPHAELASLLDGASGLLAEHRAKRILAAAGIAVTRERLATSPAEAARHAREIGFPVVLKVQSPDVPHKTEAGGVRVGLADGHAVQAAFTEILASAARHRPDARIDGVLVQEQVQDGVEMIIGINRDPAFGPAIVLGLGGVFAEVLADVSVRLAPLGADDCRDMIRELRGAPLLHGARGRPHADVDALADALARLSGLALGAGHAIEELDVNPLFVLPRGRGVRAGDALVRLR